jgi:hypothetical protein
MKRLIALAALLCAASACTTTTDNANTTAGNANANTTATATPMPAGVTQSDIEAKEHQVWDAIKAKNWDAFGGLLSDDFVIVMSDGMMNKSQTVDSLKKYDMTEYTFSDVRFVKVDEDLAVLAYTSTEKSTYDGKPTPNKPLHNSSAWVRRGGQWLAAFHQETEGMDMPQKPADANMNSASNMNANTSANTNANANMSSSNSNSNATASASPEAPDPISKEKKVWDELKAKDYDAFASDLADNAIEVEPNGIFNKAGSVSMVKKFDFSKMTLSDWKETKLDADASLVTYVVTGPMEGKTVTERHSTIWSKRGERWYAVLHQGTPQMKQ